jgi:hypothetical protein
MLIVWDRATGDIAYAHQPDQYEPTFADSFPEEVAKPEGERTLSGFNLPADQAPPIGELIDNWRVVETPEPHLEPKAAG